MKTCAVIAPHPDDETLGCGGTMSRLARQGVAVHWILMTRMTREAGFSDARIKSRDKEIARVAKILNCRQVHSLGFPTASLDEQPRSKLVMSLSRLIQSIKPALVFVPHPSDAHSDHKITFECAMAATKSFRAPFVKRMLAYETLSETDFAPTTHPLFVPQSFSDITGHLGVKQRAFRSYAGESGSHPFPRSPRALQALATLRGARAGCEHAEAFQVIKEVW